MAFGPVASDVWFRPLHPTKTQILNSLNWIGDGNADNTAVFSILLCSSLILFTKTRGQLLTMARTNTSAYTNALLILIPLFLLFPQIENDFSFYKYDPETNDGNMYDRPNAVTLPPSRFLFLVVRQIKAVLKERS